MFKVEGEAPLPKSIALSTVASELARSLAASKAGEVLLESTPEIEP